MQYFRSIDKVYHLLEYGPLGALLARAVHRTFRGMRWVVLAVVVVALAAMVGGSDEFYQSFVDTRISSVWDALFDVIGAALGCALYRRKAAGARRS